MVALATLGTASCAASTREPSPVSTAVETSAQQSTEAQKREPPGYRDSLANGDRIALSLAELFVPTGYQAPADGVVPLSLHFQGGAKAAQENFMRSSQRGVLIASTLSGRSGAFSTPYRDPAAFAQLLADGERALSQQQGREVKFGAISISFFSAGYGAVRELLKDPTWFARIATLCSADSMYASVVAKDVRAPRIEDCEGFVRFAQAAARGEKTFVVAYGMYPTDYASTSETARCRSWLRRAGCRSRCSGELTVPIGLRFTPASPRRVGRFYAAGRQRSGVASILWPVQGPSMTQCRCHPHSSCERSEGVSVRTK
jgi:hypothetical protein